MSPENNIHVVILAAGFGTRMKDALGDKPKGLAEVAGQPLVSRVLNDLYQNGFSDVSLITNGKYYDQYQQWSAAQNPAIEVVNNGVLVSEKRRGAIGDLLFYLDYLGQDVNILVCPSDTYIDGTLAEYFAQIKADPDHFTTIVRRISKDTIQRRLGCAVLSEDQSEIIGFEEKPAEPKSEFASIPFYFIPAALISLIRDYARNGGSLDAPGNLIHLMLEHHQPVHVFVLGSESLDVGTGADLEKLSSM